MRKLAITGILMLCSGCSLTVMKNGNGQYGFRASLGLNSAYGGITAENEPGKQTIGVKKAGGSVSPEDAAIAGDIAGAAVRHALGAP